MKWIAIIFTTLYIIGSYVLFTNYMPTVYWEIYTAVWVVGLVCLYVR